MTGNWWSRFGWLLVSYVAIGLVESILGMTRRAARARRGRQDAAP